MKRKIKVFNPARHVIVIGEELCIAGVGIEKRRIVATYDLGDSVAVLLRRREAEKIFNGLRKDAAAIYLQAVRMGGEYRCLEYVIYHPGGKIMDVINDIREFLANSRYLLFELN